MTFRTKQVVARHDIFSKQNPANEAKNKSTQYLNVQQLRGYARDHPLHAGAEIGCILSHHSWLQHIATATVLLEPAVVEVHHRARCLVVQCHWTTTNFGHITHARRSVCICHEVYREPVIYCQSHTHTPLCKFHQSINQSLFSIQTNNNIHTLA